MDKKVILRDIWRNFNVSLVMILPIFWKITKGVKSKSEEIPYPFVQLAFECGLLNTFLYKNGKFNNSIYLLFDRQMFIKNFSITDSRYYSICELIVDSKYFNSIEMYNDYILIELKIPEDYLEDVTLITQGKYSKVSEEYKQEIYFKNKISSAPQGKNNYGLYIVCNDLAYAISVKAIHIKEELDSIVDYDLDPKNSEFYSAFDKDNENFNVNVTRSNKELAKYAN